MKSKRNKSITAHEKLHKELDGTFEYAKKDSLTNADFDHKNASIKVSMFLNLAIYDKLKDFTNKTNGKYQVLINDILKEYTDVYLEKQANAITNEMAKFTKRRKAS